MKQLVFILLLIFAGDALLAQNEANVWYFGDYAGLDFSNGDPIALTNGALSTVEGCATVCAINGAVLFYTDGVTVYDASHNSMPNGTELLGDWSATQSSIIVTNPANEHLYYVFTVGENGENGLRYSEVDMNLNNGMGDIVMATKNTQLFNENGYSMNVTEKITAIIHSNNKSIWVIAHQAATNKFYTYLIDYNTGNISGATAYSVGSNHISNWGSTHGYMKAALDGSKIALAIHSNTSDGKFELFDFNNISGEISNPRTAPNIYRPYGIEFSPDGTKLYGTSISFSPSSTPSKLYQFDCESSGFLASMTEIEVSNSNNMMALQLGPNGKIYVALNYINHLGAINNPNGPAPDCDFVSNAVSLNTGVSRFGLPNTVVGTTVIDFIYLNICFGDITTFNISNTANIDSVLWDFDDPGSGMQNTSTLFNPTHVFSAPENYIVNLTIFTSEEPTSITNEVIIYPLPDISIGNDTTICSGEALVLEPIGDFLSYLWQDGSIEPTFTVNQSGLYWLEVENEFGCVNRDSIDVVITMGPDIWLGKDSTLCTGDTIVLCVGDEYQDYLWQDVSTDSCFSANTTGNYWVEVGDEFGCVGYDTISLTFLPGPDVSLGNDTLVCFNEYLQLDAGDGYENYLWQDSSGGQTFIVNQAGEYWVEVSNECGFGSDSISVEFSQPFDIWLGNDTSFCYGQNVVLDAGTGFSSYFWNNGSTSQSITAASTGYYWVEVSDSLDCTATDSIYIEAFMDFTISIGEDTVKICEGDYTFLNGPEGYPSYLWQDGSTYPTLLADTAGIYWLEVTDENGCAARDSTVLIVNIIPADLLGNDTVICPGAELTLHAKLGFQTYLWQDGTTSSTFVCDHAGKFWVTILDEIGCSGTDTILVSPFDEPGLNLAQEEWICHGESLLLNAGEGYLSYLWQDGSSEAEYLATDEGFYKVLVETICGFYTDSVEVYFYEGNLDLGRDTILCDGEQLILYPGQGYSNYFWSNGSTDSILIVGEKGDYWLEAFDGFCNISDSIAVDACANIWIPNVFTPNGDEYNQTFYAEAENPSGITQFKLTIFNRWGRIIYETDDIDGKWDGRLNGNECSPGAYFWVCDYQAIDKYGSPKNHSKQGSVTLLR